ncbi:MAG: MBL fold metallo-hydrolase [Syntrophales bacterium]|nr:MBL fold metallo-hydrolase [Syntrophales bacterium]
MFLAHLINEPCSDPGLYVKLKHRKDAFLFDLGDVSRLSPRQLLRLSHVFVSHTHMDHFIGFDHLLRVSLGRNGHIALFGPQGFIKNVEGKLAAYTWNLVHNYRNDFTLRVTELREDSTETRQYQCRKAFEPEPLSSSDAFESLIVDRDDLTVKAAFLDHRVPCLAFALKEKQHINIMKNALDEMGLARGKWLRDLKEAIGKGLPDETPILALTKEGDGEGGARGETIALGDLAPRIVKITPGRKISYVTDASYSEENVRRIVALAGGSDMLFIEAAFLEEDRDKAAETCHLTARQAGEIAGKAGAKIFRIFHMSPKYRGLEDLLFREALDSTRDFPGSGLYS